MSEEDLESLGLIVDDLDFAYEATALPVSDTIHKIGLKGAVEKARDALRSFCLAHDFDPWGDQP